MYLTPPCPDCSTATERIEVEGEEVWRCTAPDCNRRTYGTGDPDDDDALPPYTETDKDGTVFVYHGTGEVDVEATAEWASQEADDEEDGDDDAGGGDDPQPPSFSLAPGTAGTRARDGWDPGDEDTVPAHQFLTVGNSGHPVGTGTGTGDVSQRPAAPGVPTTRPEWGRW